MSATRRSASGPAGRVLRAVFLPVSVLILVAAALFVPLPWFVEAPGRPLSLTEQVRVDAPDAGEVEGDYLLMSVNLRRATTVSLLGAAVDGERALVAERRIVPEGLDEGAYFDRQRHVFRTTADVAAAIGLAAAGFDVDAEALTGEGAEVLRVLPGTPAEGVLEPADVITGAAGEEVRTDADLRDAVVMTGEHALPLRVRRGGELLDVALTPQLVDHGDGPPRPVIGIELRTAAPRLDLPVSVEVDAGRIGGPSAGLMIALTVYDKVEGTDLAAGRRIAGTGGLDADGRVTPIGGIAQKVVAAHLDDADVFLAPAPQIDEARRAIPRGSNLRVEPITTFDEALSLLSAAPAAR